MIAGLCVGALTMSVRIFRRRVTYDAHSRVTATTADSTPPAPLPCDTVATAVSTNGSSAEAPPDSAAMEQSEDDAAVVGESLAVAQRALVRARHQRKLLRAHVATMKAKRKGVEMARLTKALAAWRMRTLRAKAQHGETAAEEGGVAVPEEQTELASPERNVCVSCFNAEREASFVHGETAHFTSCFNCASEWVDEHGSCPHCRRQCVVVRTFL